MESLGMLASIYGLSGSSCHVRLGTLMRMRSDTED